MKTIIIAVDDISELESSMALVSASLGNLTGNQVALDAILGVDISYSLDHIKARIKDLGIGEDNILGGFLVDIFDEDLKDRSAGFKLCRSLKAEYSGCIVVCVTSRYFDIDQDPLIESGVDLVIQRGGVLNFNKMAEKLLEAYKLTHLKK